MAFFNSAVGVLQTLVVALGAGLGIWGAINLLEGYGNDNPGAKVKEHMKNRALAEAGWPTDHISQQRLIKCPYPDCGEEFVVDFADYSDEQESEGSMGGRCEHIFDTSDIECPECRRRLRAVGIISEYPIGAYEYEKITIEEDEE